MMDYRTSRHQSLPLDSHLGGTRVPANERRRRSSPVVPTARSGCAITIGRKRGSLNAHNTGVNQDSRSNAATLFASPISLEPIPQGQELSVQSTHWSHICGHTPSNYTSGLTTTDDTLPCCGCRGGGEQHASNGGGGVCPNGMDNKNGYTAASGKINPGKEQSSRHEQRCQSSSIPGSQWAKEFIGRLRSNSSVDPTEVKSFDQNRRGSTPRSAQENKRTVQNPDGIDPRRLPKTSAPPSTQLQFSKKPLNVTSSSTPIPVANNRSPFLTQSAAVAASSWRQRNKAPKVRWLSQSSSVASGPSDLFFAPSSLNARLSYSAVEEFQGAVDLLAGRQQLPTPTGKGPVRTGVRVKRASESDRFLVISKSLSDSREDFSPCALEHFDENHVYNTLFRHSTCYDVLPDSGKLVILDSRLGIVRAIRALLENGIPAAPIWHSPTQSVTGLLSQELALHLLNSLLCHTENRTDKPCSTTQIDHGLKTGETTKLNSIKEGLRHWGAQHLCDVLRLFRSDPDKARYSPAEFDPTALVISPQTALKRALCRLIHYSHRMYRFSSHSTRPLTDNQTSDYRSLSSSLSSDVSTGRPMAQQHQTVRQISEPATSTQSTRSSPLPSPTHLIVVNSTCGNVLGVLGVDRLLAYFRLRLDELPYSPQMMFTIDSIPGLRWSDRQRLFRTSPFRVRKLLCGDLVDTETVDSVPEPPIIYPQTSCRKALASLTMWLSQLPALPVVAPSGQSVTATAVVAQSPLIGLIAPGDLLHFFLDGCPDTAANQPVSKILEVKLAHCRYLHECVCHTQETLADALDRMFRLRTPCLVLFDSPRVHSPNPMSALCGPPIGMLTAKELLCAILGTNPNHHHHHHHHHASPPNSKWIPGSSPMDVFDEDSIRSLDSQAITSDARGGDTLELSSSSSSDDESSSGSTYSARSGSPPTRQDSLSLSQCGCPCHRDQQERPMDTSESSTEQLDGTRNPSGSLNRLSSRAANQSVRFAEPSTPQPSESSDHQRRNSSNRRAGEEDDALFPMD